MIDLEQFAVVTENVGPWVLHLVCCGRDEGMLAFATRDQADAAREAYTSGQGVADHGYSADASGSDHRRAAILYTAPGLLSHALQLRSDLAAEKQRADAAEAALAEERRGRKSDCATLALVRAALRGMGYALDKAHADLVAERHAHGLTEGERREAMRLLANALLAAHGAPALVGTCVQMTTPHTLSDHVQVYRHACEWAALAATKEKSDAE